MRQIFDDFRATQDLLAFSDGQSDNFGKVGEGVGESDDGDTVMGAPVGDGDVGIELGIELGDAVGTSVTGRDVGIKVGGTTGASVGSQ